MKAVEYEALRKVLLEQKSNLLNKSYYFRESQMGGAVGDEADHANDEFCVNMNLRLIERERLLIQKIDYALAKIEAGDYGYCEECDEPMGFKRLLARPVASLCISCKEEQEKQERSYA